MSENPKQLMPGDRVIHSGVTTTTWYGPNGIRSETKEPFKDKGILLDIGPDDRCEILCDDGVTIDNIYINALRHE